MPRALDIIHLPLGAYMPSRKVLLFAAVSSVAIAAFALVYWQQPYLHAFNSFNHGVAAAGGSMMSASAASASTSAAAGTKAMLEMDIANDGLVYLASARIESFAGDSFTVGIAWGSTTFTWTVDTTSGKGGTQFIQPGGNNSGTINDLTIGDAVDITGMLDPGASSPTIDAQFVRE